MAWPDDETHASLLALTEQAMGDALDTAASSGATTLSLYDVSDFDEDGGSVLVEGVVYTYDTVDMDLDTIHLTSGLTSSAAVDEPVYVWDPEAGNTVTERVALVTLDDQDGGDPVSVDVDHSLHPLLPRATLAAGQSVSLRSEGATHRLVGVHGKNTQALARTDSANVYLGVDDGEGSVFGIIATLGGTVVRAGTAGDFRVKTPDGASYMPVLASAFTVSSDSKVKTRPTKGPDALAIIAAAPSKHWRYRTDEKSVKRAGPIADDLPDWMVHEVHEEDGSTVKHVDLARMVGVLWQACSQLAARVEALEKR